LTTPAFDALLYKMFRTTYGFWLGQPDPALWLIAERRADEPPDESAYLELIRPLSHHRFRRLILDLEALRPRDGEPPGARMKDFLALPDYFSIIDAISTWPTRSKNPRLTRAAIWSSSISSSALCRRRAAGHPCQRLARNQPLAQAGFPGGEKGKPGRFRAQDFRLPEEEHGRKTSFAARASTASSRPPARFSRKNAHPLGGDLIDELINYGC
jgi:pyruvate,orthophosphate dikinase